MITNPFLAWNSQHGWHIVCKLLFYTNVLFSKELHYQPHIGEQNHIYTGWA